MEFEVGGNCPAVGLAELGALPRSVVGDHGDGTIVAELPASYDASEVVSTFQSEYGGELRAKREREAFTPLFSQRELEQALDRRLTDRRAQTALAGVRAVIGTVHGVAGPVGRGGAVRRGHTRLTEAPGLSVPTGYQR